MLTSVLWRTTAALVVVFGLADGVSANPSDVNAENCRSGIDVYNRAFRLSAGARRSTVLQYAMNTAVNRAVFYSLMYNWTAIDVLMPPRQAMQEYGRQPGLNYIYMSTAANVHAAPVGVEASGLFFDVNSSYPNWLRDVSFNGTLQLFGIRDAQNMIKDFGSTPESDYTDSSIYPQNGFFQDLRGSNSANQMKYFEMLLYGQWGIDDERFVGINKVSEAAGHFTAPYFDCGQTNEWLLDAVSMVTELMARNSLWMNLRHMKSVAASTVSVSLGALHGIDPETGMAADRPRVTPARYAQGVRKLQEEDATSCKNLVAPMQPVPLSRDFWNPQDLALTLEAQGRAALRLSHFLSNFMQNNDFADNERNVQIQNEAYRNWRLGEDPPTFDSPMIEVLIDQDLTYKQLASEVFATLVSDDKIGSVGIFLDRGVFPESNNPVSAFAWRGNHDNQGNIVDVYEDGDDYTMEDWFIQAKQAYAQTSGSNTKSFSTGRQVRASRTGAARPTPEPVTYIATSYDQGTWLSPKFLCSWVQAGWTASYVSPILIRGSLGQGPVFGGVVKVDAAFTADNVSI